MKIKKVLPVLALTVALVGCGKKADTTSNASSTPASTTTTENLILTLVQWIQTQQAHHHQTMLVHLLQTLDQINN